MPADACQGARENFDTAGILREFDLDWHPRVSLLAFATDNGC